MTDNTPEKPLFDPDLDRLDDAIEEIAAQVSPFLDPETRARVYTVTTIVGASATAAGASLMSVAAVIGGEVAVTLLVIGGVLTTIGSGFGAASARLARKNVSIPAE